MRRSTIDFGIDLGTTNSAIAMIDGTGTRVFKNNDNQEFTPSAIWIDTRDELRVGQRAKDRLESDPDNTASEFKKRMGTLQTYSFSRSGKTMLPEELSAEILKALKSTVQQRIGEEIDAAVICVPADFDLPHNQATRKAAQLAGLEISPLLQEPIAAALAYGFQNASDRAFWLVYDLGGGTFDAAVIQLQDGLIQVINHGGDRDLGGKLIDWKIVEEVFIPAITTEYRLTDLNRGNPKWQTAIATLKAAAEKAKINLSQDSVIQSEIQFKDDRGKIFEFQCELARMDVERLMEPYVLRTINICKKILSEKKLSPADIHKLILVGGPTLTPYLRERLADPREGLGVTLDFALDPMTVVAQGAAIFASTQSLHKEVKKSTGNSQPGKLYVTMTEWKFTDSEPEPVVAGVVSGDSTNELQDHTVEFVNATARPQWRSGKIHLSPNGGFLTTLLADRGHANRFEVEVRDRTGNLCESVVEPNPLVYTVGSVIGGAPLTHSIGVALANNEMEWFFEKGAPLPARKPRRLKTTHEVRPGHIGQLIRVMIREGSSPRADRNRLIGKLEINSDQIRRAVPAGADIEVTIEIDASRLLRATAYIPLLEEEFEGIHHLGREEEQEPSGLERSIAEEGLRFQRMRDAASQGSDPIVNRIIQRIEKENIEQDIQSLLGASAVDPDAYDMAANRLRDLRIALDEVENYMEWPLLVSKAEGLIEGVKGIIDDHGDSTDKRDFQIREKDLRSAIQTRLTDVLSQRTEQLRLLGTRVLDKKGILPVLTFQQLEQLQSDMSDKQRIIQLIQQGKKAIDSNDPATLRGVNQELISLLPSTPPPLDISTLLR